MSRAGLRHCVVDANVVLKLFLEQPGSDQADALFARLGTDAQARYYAPDLIYGECASALAKYVRLRGLSAAEARKSLNALLGLGLVAVPTVELVNDALDVALKYQITGYDACYVVLAGRLKIPLVTADERLSNALAGTIYDLRLLSQPGLDS